MQGLELSEKFYFDVVKKLINKEFPMLENKYAAGLIGYGSDVLGNDDVLSRDHEWGPRCHIWLSDEDYERYAQAIDQMLLMQLPLTYLGYQTRYRWNDEFRALVGSGYKGEQSTSYCYNNSRKTFEDSIWDTQTTRTI